MTNDIITVVRDTEHPLGKQFFFGDDGNIQKKAAVTVALGEAIQHEVPDVKALERLLADVAEDPHAAIINSAFPLVNVGEPFLLLSEAKFEKLGIKRRDTNVVWPVKIKYDGKSWPALGRFKEHTAPSSWVLLDRDIDHHTPSQFANLSYEEWLQAVEKLLPGVLASARLRAFSSSARISVDGQPVGAGNGHTWLQVRHPEDIERMRTTLQTRAPDLGMAWKKPRISKTTGEITGESMATIIDTSVFVPGRLVFVGKPEVRHAF
jgi:hypothetical protein